jgi:hypothetical protein
MVFQNSCGWIDNEILLVWLEKVIYNLDLDSYPILPYLILDQCPAHTHKNVTNYLAEKKIKHRFIPSGATGLVQPVDTHVGKAFKDYLKSLHKIWFDEIGSKEENTTKAGYYKDPSSALIIEWVLSAFNEIKRDSIINSFKHCGITLSLDGKEDHLLNPKIKDKEDFLNRIREILIGEDQDISCAELDEALNLRNEFLETQVENTFEPTRDQVELSDSSDDDEENDSNDFIPGSIEEELAIQIKQEEGVEILTSKRRSINNESTNGNT